MRRWWWSSRDLMSCLAAAVLWGAMIKRITVAPGNGTNFSVATWSADGTPCPSPSKSSSSSSRSMNVLITIAIVVVAIGAVLAVAGVIAVVQARRNESRNAGVTETQGGSPDAAKVTSAPAVKIEKGGMDQHGGVVTPTAGKRGAANFGASYKATLLNGPSLVVKRFKDMNGVGHEDFSEHMRRLGQLVHPNLLPVIAYLYKKEEKLLVTDYMAMMVAYKSPSRGARGDRAEERRVEPGHPHPGGADGVTGKFPPTTSGRPQRASTSPGGSTRWCGGVNSAGVRQRHAGAASGEGQMGKLLQVGLGCCEPNVGRRWGLEEALMRIEELWECNNADDSSTASSFLSDREPATASRPPGEPQSHSE
ncbi:unnamed protein product [Miscanthus lutarioriparius]|uniref:Protein kinase domain-containing protein n=1 Tax=Miscanthus lutarioriparius TaxID=422564 RepID=A0A811SBW0_9POAL|nr:unnamed protein product [Miscanthus lutarioriparius]